MFLQNADPQELQGMMGAPPEERGFFNGDNHMGRGGPGPRGGPAGRGGMLNAPGRGGMAPRYILVGHNLVIVSLLQSVRCCHIFM